MGCPAPAPDIKRVQLTRVGKTECILLRKYFDNWFMFFNIIKVKIIYSIKKQDIDLK